jgi:hypothetical protein
MCRHIADDLQRISDILYNTFVNLTQDRTVESDDITLDLAIIAEAIDYHVLDAQREDAAAYSEQKRLLAEAIGQRFIDAILEAQATVVKRESDAVDAMVDSLKA